MNKEIKYDELLLTEKSQKDFSKKVLLGGYKNCDILEYIEFRYFFIEYNKNFLGYVILAKTFNKMAVQITNNLSTIQKQNDVQKAHTY